MRPLTAHCCLGLGKLHRHSSRVAAADQHLRVAEATYREMYMAFWLEKAEDASR
jgi:hypothetical protein